MMTPEEFERAVQDAIAKSNSNGFRVETTPEQDAQARNLQSWLESRESEGQRLFRLWFIACLTDQEDGPEGNQE